MCHYTMKNLFIFLSTIILSFTIGGCKDQNKENNSDVTRTNIDIETQSGELAIYPITDAIQVEGGYEITKQAKNYNKSEIINGGQKAAIEYHYQSKEGFTGTETVEITSSYSIGDSNFKVGEIITLTITVK